VLDTILSVLAGTLLPLTHKLLVLTILVNWENHGISNSWIFTASAAVRSIGVEFRVVAKSTSHKPTGKSQRMHQSGAVAQEALHCLVDQRGCHTRSRQRMHLGALTSYRWRSNDGGLCWVERFPSEETIVARSIAMLDASRPLQHSSQKVGGCLRTFQVSRPRSSNISAGPRWYHDGTNWSLTRHFCSWQQKYSGLVQRKGLTILHGPISSPPNRANASRKDMSSD
jgi:hypothetical protein